MAITLNRSSKLNGISTVDDEGRPGSSMPDPAAPNDPILSALFDVDQLLTVDIRDPEAEVPANPSSMTALAPGAGRLPITDVVDSPAAITLNISGEVNGTFTIEDDGTAGNGISVLRRPNGTIFSTFAHPADALTIVSRAGQNFNINFTDSLTTANFTVGSLTVPSQNPDNIFVGGILTSGIVTLAARQAISELGSDGATDIVGGRLFLDAGTGIGQFNAIETQVSLLEAETVSGGINLSNINSVTIGGAALGTAELRGLFSGSGNVTLINQGSILLSDTDGVESARSGGNLTLSAIGAAADISSNVNRDSLLAVGNIVLNTGRDVLFGTGGADFDNDVRAGGSIFISAGRDFRIDGFSDMASDDQGLLTDGGVTITAGRNILIEDDFGVDASVGVTRTQSAGAVVLTTGIGGTLSLTANSSAAIQGRNGGVIIRADRMLIENDSGINVTGTGGVTLTTASFGRDILVGSVTDGVTALELSDAELDRVVTGNLTIGGSDSGTLSVVNAISQTNNNLTLRGGGDVIVSANVTTPGSLTLISAENVVQTIGTITTATFTASVDTPDFDPAGGTLAINGTLTTTITVLNGGPDNDTLTGGANDDIILGGGGLDVLNGGAGADQLFGEGGNDQLIGGPGLDTMVGGTGDDQYFVTESGDSVVEAEGQGNDRIFASVSYTVSNSQEIEIISTADSAGLDAINLTGNVFGQTIFGNAGDNILTGGGGADTIIGFGGDDQLFGNADAPSTLQGGTGGDTYFISLTGDSLVEFEGEGNDRILTSVSYTMSNNQEIETLAVANQAGTAAIDLAGNIYAQLILGNQGVNTLSGGGGDDVLAGLGGADILLGGDGADQLNGGTGNDVLNGGAGGDIFIFADPLGAGNIDGIQDFVTGQDRLFLENAVFVGLPAGVLAVGALVNGSVAQDADDRILYDPGTGALFFDPDGTGAAAAVQFATLVPGTALAASDIVVI